MILWLTFAVMSAGVLAVLLRSVFQSGSVAASRASHDIEVFCDQLKELDRDEAQGLIGHLDAQSARNEISRRILALDYENKSKSPQDVSPESRKLAGFGGLVIVPALAVGFYLLVGNPNFRDVPLETRIANAEQNRDMAALIVVAERKLKNRPNDIRGWLVIANAYRGQRRYAEASSAYKRVIKLGTPSAKLWNAYAEAVVLANGGRVTTEAARGFSEAIKLETDNSKSRFYLALQLAQRGKKKEALEAFTALRQKLPPGSAAHKAVQRQIAGLDPNAVTKGPSKQQIKDAASMTTAERKEMIIGMVNSLADRLKENGNDLDGWLRLAQVRKVLGETDKAKAALDSASAIFKNDQQALEKIKLARKRLDLK